MANSPASAVRPRSILKKQKIDHASNPTTKVTATTNIASTSNVKNSNPSTLPKSILKTTQPAKKGKGREKDILPEPVQMEDSESSDDLDLDEDEFPTESEDEDESGSGDEDEDEEAIREMGEDKKGNGVKKIKNKTLRPTDAASFSLALTHMLSLPPTASNPVPARAPQSAASARLERRARSFIRQTKSEHLARGHVRDVIEGWGSRPQLPFHEWESQSARQFQRAKAQFSTNEHGLDHDAEEGETGAERETRLRKLAQRGVVRLFNAIGAAQGAAIAPEEVKKRKAEDDAGYEDASHEINGEGGEAGVGGRVTRRPNVLGARGKGEALTNLSKATFLDLIRAGTTTVSPLAISSR